MCRARQAPQLNVLDLWPLRWHCKRALHAAVWSIATWAQEYYGKLLSFNTVCSCIEKYNVNLCYTRRNLYINSRQKHQGVLWARAHLRLSKRQWKCVLWSDESTLQLVLGENRQQIVSPEDERDHPDFSQWQVRKGTFVMLWRCIGLWVACVYDCMEAYIGIVQRHILPSRWHLSWEVHGY